MKNPRPRPSRKVRARDRLSVKKVAVEAVDAISNPVTATMVGIATTGVDPGKRTSKVVTIGTATMTGMIETIAVIATTETAAIITTITKTFDLKCITMNRSKRT